jgi:Holliday junction DNA helicase RuvA
VAKLVITQIRGILRSVAEESCILGVEPFMDLEVLIPEYARRQLQAKRDEPVVLHTVFDIEGNQMSGRMRPRLIGFLTPVDREFFDVFCSVDGVGVRKALRAMVRPVRELARMIQDSDVRTLATFPGIGEATAERIVAKLRRKVGKFALMVGPADDDPSAVGAQERNGEDPNAEPDVIRDTYNALLTVGHSEAQARHLLDQVLAGKKKYKTVDAMLIAIYEQEKPKG